MAAPPLQPGFAAVRYGRRGKGVGKYTRLYFVTPFPLSGGRLDFVSEFFRHVESLEPGGRRRFSGAFHGVPRYDAPSGTEYRYCGVTRPSLDGYAFDNTP